MAGTAIQMLRHRVRGNSTAALAAMVSQFGRANAPGWNVPGTVRPHIGGAIVIAVIRAELLCRRQASQGAR